MGGDRSGDDPRPPEPPIRDSCRHIRDGGNGAILGHGPSAGSSLRLGMKPRRSMTHPIVPRILWTTPRSGGCGLHPIYPSESRLLISMLTFDVTSAG